jgi:hypothetical protein
LKACRTCHHNGGGTCQDGCNPFSIHRQISSGIAPVLVGRSHCIARRKNNITPWREPLVRAVAAKPFNSNILLPACGWNSRHMVARSISLGMSKRSLSGSALPRLEQ